MSDPQSGTEPSNNAASTVAGAILTSRIMGFIRERAVVHFFGLGAFTDVFQAAMKGPNLLQNLLGEGTISASFIPIYSRLLEEGREEDAGRFAGAIFGLLIAIASALTLVGIAFAEPIVTVLAPGFTNDAAAVADGTLPVNRFRLTVMGVQLLFPMAGMLVISAWALGVLNSHRRFFLPYFAPVLWNVAIIAGLFLGGVTVTNGLSTAVSEPGLLQTQTLTVILRTAFLGALVGGALQFLVQLPLVLRLMKGFVPSISTRVVGVREAIEAFWPVVAGRGVYQLSAYLDVFLASFLASGAVGALRPAQIVYILPISVFGMSVAAAELPELSSLHTKKIQTFLDRLQRSIRQILFLILPTFWGYLVFGFLIVGALFRSGDFQVQEQWLVYFILGSYSLGLVATTISRLLQNSFYALNDTRTPAKIAVGRVVLSALVAVPTMLLLDQWSVAEVIPTVESANSLQLGAVGLAIGATAGAWLEVWQLKRSLGRKIDLFSLPWDALGKMMALALISTVFAGPVWYVMPAVHPILMALVVISVYAGCYLGMAHLTGRPELQTWIGQLR